MGFLGLFFRLTENPRVGDSILSLITERAGHDPLVSHQVVGGSTRLRSVVCQICATLK